MPLVKVGYPCYYLGYTQPIKLWRRFYLIILPPSSEQLTGQIEDFVQFVNHACAFTGHRPQKFPWRNDETASACIALKDKLTEQVAALADAGITNFLSGMAQATDTWAALSVLALRENNPALKLHCILPCVGQDAK